MEGINISSDGTMGGLSLEWSFSLSHIDINIEEVESAHWRFTGFYGHPVKNLRHYL